MQSMRETAANVGASTKAGMEKAKASMQEKVDKMKSRDRNEKEMARERKEVREEEAEQIKEDARDQTAIAKQAGGGYTTGGFNRGDANRCYTAAATTTTQTTGPGYDAGSGARNARVAENDPFYGSYD